MFQRILQEMRDRVRQRQLVMTLHAEEEMTDDGFNIFDLERGILTGEIVERQKDGLLNEWKYLIQGETVNGDNIEIVAKIGPTGKLVVITVFRPNPDKG